MKRIFMVLFTLLLVISSIAPGASLAAEPLPLLAPDAKATITIEKTAGQDEDGSGEVSDGVLQFRKSSYDISVGQYIKNLWEIELVFVEPDGRSISVNPNDVMFTTSDEKVFTVGQGSLNSIAIGTATLTAFYKGKTAKTTINVVDNDSVTFKLPIKAPYVYVYSLNYVEKDQYYTSYRRMNVSSSYNSTTDELKISGIDWDRAEPYTALVAVNNRRVDYPKLYNPFLNNEPIQGGCF